MYYVYKVINKLNGKFYIGKRKHNYPELDSYMGSGSLIKKAISKHGLHNFSKEILGIFSTDEEAAELEKSLVTKDLLLSNISYNLHEGGFGGFFHVHSSKELNDKRLENYRKNNCKSFTHNCLECTSEFITNLSKPRKFCSVKCSNIFYNKQRKAKPTTSCAFCGEPLYRCPSLLRDYSKSFCNKSHAAKYKRSINKDNGRQFIF